MSQTFVSIDPTTGRELARYAALDDAARAHALDRAQEAFLRWRQVPIAQRAQILLAVARQLEFEQRDVAAVVTREVGKTFKDALGELKKCITTTRWFAEHGPALLADERADTEAQSSYVRYEPLGVLLAVMPWNFPFWQVFRFGIPALLAGNTILVKHAPSTMGCSARLEAVFRQAGAPRGLVTHFPIDIADVPAVAADPRVRGMTFTGSTATGRILAKLAGEHAKPIVLELGGSDPFIVMPSADLDQTVRMAVLARIQNAGQSCIAAKRFLVHASIYDTFAAKLTAAMQALRVGDPMDESVDMGPLSTALARQRLLAAIDASVAAGATLLAGGRALPGPGFFVAPTVLGDVPATAPAATEELFGPVCALFRVADLDGAIQLANSSSFGLSASIWTADASEAERAISGIDAGSVFVNAMPRSDARLPFGGTKASGFGRELGRAGLHAFTNPKTIWIR